jgi:hypothetical protein
MAGALAIAAITATLRNLLGNGLAASPDVESVGDVTVSALPPDRVTTGTEEHNQLNLFMYRVGPHTRLSNTTTTKRGVPEKGEQEHQSRLALNLYYLVTAYGAQDFHADILLGCAMKFFLKTPVLSREMIREALGSGSSKKTKGLLPPAQAALAKSDLADQIEEVRLTPKFLDSEESSKLWSALQARYRPSISYEVSAVIINGANRK